VDNKGAIKYQEVPRNATMLDYVDELSNKGFVEMRSRGDKSTSGDAPTDAQTTKVYFDALRDIAKNGICLKGKVALITGLSPGSIAEPVAKVLLQAGATVIATMRPKSGGKSYTFFRDLYSDYCGAGARLIAVPFNQASRQDVFNLVKFIYAKQGQGGGLELDLDFVFPFAAAPENGRGIEKVDDISELAHRVMLTHTVLLVGKISEAKKQQKIVRKQALVFTPLSPNHGVFGYDGLYAESKLGLEAFFHKWKSEHLQDYLSIVGVTIGWVRGTNLMASQNTVALSVENSGARTFTTAEMAFNMAGLMHPDMVRIVQQQTMEAMLSEVWRRSLIFRE
jgi:3-oxoacyl-ACP reductase-like protein